jgi:hypothetical protein
MMLALAASVASGLWATDLSAQETQTSYTYSRCAKAHPGKMTELRAFFETTARTIGEEGVKAGSLVAYTVLEAVTPRGRDTRCDFIVNSRFPGYPSSLSPSFDAAMKKLRMESGQFFRQLDEAGYLVRTNLWRGVSEAGMGKEGAYIVIDLMKTKDRAAWEEMEDKVFKPAQQLRVKSGDALAWGAASLVMPRGTGLEYDAVTFSIYPDMKSTGTPPRYRQRLAEAHPGKNFDDLPAKVQATRDIVESGMYEVIVAVMPK